MNISDVSPLAGMTAAPLDAQGPRAVDAATKEQFRELMSSSDCKQTAVTCDAQPSMQARMGMDIEKILMANLPPPNASPAEFAVSMLRAQVKVAQAAVAIEMVNKTTQSLSQGIQSLTTTS